MTMYDDGYPLGLGSLDPIAQTLYDVTNALYPDDVMMTSWYLGYVYIVCLGVPMTPS